MIPVCINLNRDCLGIMPEAFRSPDSGLNLSLDPKGPLPSMDLPRASTTLPRHSMLKGTSTMAPVLLTTSPWAEKIFRKV